MDRNDDDVDEYADLQYPEVTTHTPRRKTMGELHSDLRDLLPFGNLSGDDNDDEYDLPLPPSISPPEDQEYQGVMHILNRLPTVPSINPMSHNNWLRNKMGDPVVGEVEHSFEEEPINIEIKKESDMNPLDIRNTFVESREDILQLLQHVILLIESKIGRPYRNSLQHLQLQNFLTDAINRKDHILIYNEMDAQLFTQQYLR